MGAGTEMELARMKRGPADEEARWMLVENARSTWATEPETSIQPRPAGMETCSNPSLWSQVTTALTSDAEFE